ncbi:MAG TPA: GGDEF domain-containing protein [Xanthobacteraceae bacterium]|jgi:diguanylate cyclase (GGDEF)-like protein|nr:GGDEF domain-containing protein [Xanthobacteraceae bacterium]
MFASLAEAAMSLDIGTLFVIAICVTSLLGLFLLFAWLQDGITALAWWGLAYLIGGLSGVLWRLGDLILPVPPSIADILLFIAVGMVWSAARLFHGRPVLWGSMCLGAVVWVAFGSSSAFMTTETSRLVVSSVIIATYTFLTAIELWRERRQSLIRRWPAIFVPMLHGVIFLFPVALAGLSQDGIGNRTLGAGWVAVYAIEVVLYVVGAAFIVLVLAKDRTVRQYKLAAATDPLTELLNRRGFFEAAAEIMTARQAGKEPVCVLAFDLDHFKAINDRFGHNSGDATLHLFATVVKKTLRAGDAIGRLGGEEFIALLPSTLGDATAAANRVRRAFAAASAVPGSHAAATVSVGVSCGSASADIDTLIARADAALYRAKTNGRDRVEASDEAVPGAPERRGAGAAQNPQGAVLQPVPNLSVPLVGSLRAARQDALCRS